jgi:hypothetical protein
MTGAYPAVTDCAVTAAAMRAAAVIIEQSALPGLSVTCTSGEITIQVCGHAGDAAGRAAQVGRLAEIAGTRAYRDDSHAAAYSQVKAYGQVHGIPVSIFTPVEVRTRPSSTGPVPLGAGSGGQVTAVPGGKLPHGWRWVTELDQIPGGQEVTA